MMLISFLVGYLCPQCLMSPHSAYGFSFTRVFYVMLPLPVLHANTFHVLTVLDVTSFHDVGSEPCVYDSVQC